MDMRDGLGLYFASGVDPEKLDTPGCRVRMARLGEDLLVRDNGQCGARLRRNLRPRKGGGAVMPQHGDAQGG